MNLLPYERFTIHTYLSRDEVNTRLAGVIEPTKWLRWGSGEKPYQGEAGDGWFKASRIIGYRNSFLPQIAGQIIDDLGQTSVRITMRLHWFVMIFMGFWLGSVGFGFLSALVRLIIAAGQSSTSGSENLYAIMQGTGLMFAFGAIITVGGFKFESLKSKKFFRDLLEDTTV